MNVLLMTLLFVKVGTFIFGGGFAMIPLIESEVVAHHHWLTHREFLDALALGQVTPGPFLISSAFIGYRVGGLFGAFLATVAIFAPSFLMTLLVSGPLLRIQGNAWVEAFLKGLMPAIVGVLLIAGAKLGQTALTGYSSFLIFLVGLVTLVRFKVDPALVIAASALVGFLLR